MPRKLIRRATELRANYGISNRPLLHAVEKPIFHAQKLYTQIGYVP